MHTTHLNTCLSNTGYYERNRGDSGGGTELGRKIYFIIKKIVV